MKTATEYDVPENYKSPETINATCPECGKSNLLRSTDFINGYCICRAFTNPHSFKILSLSKILKQAKEKRETEQQVQEAVQVACLEGVLESVVLDAAKENLHDPVSHPKHYTATGIEAIVCQDIADRQGTGVAKYGTTVEENPLDLREWLQHAYEECLDQAVYLRRAIYEMDNPIADDTKKIEAFYGVRQYIDREIQRLEGGA